MNLKTSICAAAVMLAMGLGASSAAFAKAHDQSANGGPESTGSNAENAQTETALGPQAVASGQRGGQRGEAASDGKRQGPDPD